MSTAPEKVFPFLVEVTARESGLRQYGAVNLAQILTIDKICIGDKCGQLSGQKMLEVDKAIRISLEITG